MAFRIVVLVLAGFVLVFFGVGALLPARWNVESTQVVAATPEQILPLLQDFTTWERWSAVEASPGPNSKRTVDGTAGTPGHRLRWVGSEGEATFTLERVDRTGIAYQYSVRSSADREPQPRGNGTVTLAPVADGTQVTWRDESVAESLPLRWFCWFGALQEAYRRAQVASLGGLKQMFAPANAKTPEPRK